MDIGQYVGLFLLKNEYCYLPGIGSLQVIKRTAHFNKETLNTEAPGYEIVFVKGGGSVDDTFANFIANNERISIAQAANHLKDYAAACKALLLEGNDVVVYGIGKFISKNKGEEIYFETDAGLRIQGKQIPFFKISDSVEERKKEDAISTIIEQTNFKQPKGDEEIVIKPAQVNWGKIALVAGIVLVLLALAVYLVYYFNNNQQQKENPVTNTLQTPAPIVESVDISDTATKLNDSANTVPRDTTTVPASVSNGLKIVVNSYTTMERAEARVSRLKSYNYNASAVEKGSDSMRFHAVINIDGPVANPQHIVDSVKRMLNPGGNVYQLQ